MIDEALKYFQAVANTFAIGAAGWIYLAYIKDLRTLSKIKDEQIKIEEKNNALLKDKIQELEKRQPERIEEVLSNRITRLKEEIERLVEDSKGHEKELKIKNEELLRLKSEVEKTRDVIKGIDLLDMVHDEETTINRSELEIEEIGFVSVDSAQLLITDPCYLDGWQNLHLEPIDIYKDVSNSTVYQFGKDFESYDEKIEGYDLSVNDLVESGQWTSVNLERDFEYSYSGACDASNSKKGYGQLNFSAGHKGAGIAIRTVDGDGDYSVFAEKYRGETVRVYINLI